MKNLLLLFTSKRAVVTLLVLICWVLFGIVGIKNGTDMTDLATYFAALSPFVIGYIYGETKRKSGDSQCANANCKK